MNRVRDCERKWLRRIDEEVRGKRGDEYGATRVKRHLRQARANGSAVPSPPEPPWRLPRCGLSFWVGEQFTARLQGFSGDELR